MAICPFHFYVPKIYRGAEEEGFEPPVPRYGTTVFKTAAFDHSAIPPVAKLKH